jgi:hypothetical protein
MQVAEDNKINQKVLRMMLQANCAELSIVSDGRQAVDAYNKVILIITFLLITVCCIAQFTMGVHILQYTFHYNGSYSSVTHVLKVQSTTTNLAGATATTAAATMTADTDYYCQPHCCYYNRHCTITGRPTVRYTNTRCAYA